MAAVDLGSNSFHLLVAQFSHGQLKVIDRLREMVRLAAGLDANNQLDAASQKRALECLARFGERLRDIPSDRLRVVGTNTLRKAPDPDFITQAQELLGHELDIISGIEEARLIYLGVSHCTPDVSGDQLVIDIGGGSTEIVAGKGATPHTLESLHMGCVGISQAFFSGGEITPERFFRARTAARLEMRPVQARFRRIPWERAAGASGTIRAAGAVLTEAGLIRRSITVDALEQLISTMIDQGHADELHLPGLNPERAPVFPGGVAVLIETMQALGIDELEVAEGALREGILYDLRGRLSDADSRLRTVRAMEARYSVDTEQADRVEETALLLFDQAAPAWELESPLARRVLSWAARLHEIGLDIAHAHYHSHSAYLLENADMPGFHRSEQCLLAALVAGHRRTLEEKNIRRLAGKGWGRRALRLTILLRLAVLFNRSRNPEFPEQLRLIPGKRKLTLQISSDWIDANPLTLADLESEQAFLRATDYELCLERVG